MANEEQDMMSIPELERAFIEIGVSCNYFPSGKSIRNFTGVECLPPVCGHCLQVILSSRENLPLLIGRYSKHANILLEWRLRNQV